MNETTLHTSLAKALNDLLGADMARPIPASNPIVAIADSADRDAALTAMRRLMSPATLRAHPVMLWHGPDQILLGPAGNLDVTGLIPDNRSLDVRVLPGDTDSVRIVISWIDGPTADSVRAALATTPDLGLDVDLVRENLDRLVDDVLVAVLEPSPAGCRSSKHPVLNRVAAVRDGREIYCELLDLTTATARQLHASGSDLAIRDAMTTLMLEFDNPALVNAVLDDVDIRLKRGEMFPIRPVEDAAALSALFTLACLMAQSLSSDGRRQVRKQFAM